MEAIKQKRSLISLKESFIYPHEWNHEPCDNKFILECFKESVNLGIFQIDDKKSFSYINSCLSSCAYMWPLCNHSQSLMTGRFIQWSFLIDDYLDSLEIDDKKTDSTVLNVEKALINGTITNKNSKLEEYTVFFRNKLFEYCGRERLDAFNLLINELVICLWTLVPFSKIHSKEKDFYPSYQLYRCIRTINVGIIACCALNFILFKDLDVKLWLNPRFRKILNRASIQISIVNDAVSYAKEILNENAYCNTFYFLQKDSTKFSTFDQVCEYLFNEANTYIKDIITDEPLLLHEFEDVEDRKVVQSLLNHVHYLISGNFVWSIENNQRYQSNIYFINLLQSTGKSIGSSWSNIKTFFR
uniref:Terpene synthase 10 n=1 Tax=Dictyostelium purpureum TaxID=5786 RepID=TPS10_DICPU|nr:RecName: Full=Terpene synthase 10 [Dictyostelium purpureum]AXN72979.1 terpene synthase [Dictyostelium purpureum]